MTSLWDIVKDLIQVQSTKDNNITTQMRAMSEQMAGMHQHQSDRFAELENRMERETRERLELDEIAKRSLIKEKEELSCYTDDFLIAGTDEHLDAVETRSKKTSGVASEKDARDEATATKAE